MSRIPRKECGEGFYHTMVQGINKEYIFEEPFLKAQYIKNMIKEAQKNHIEIVAFCVMDNHAHMLLHIKTSSDYTKMMSALNMKYAILYNSAKKRVGYVFRDRFKCERILNEMYLYRCIRYIHRNPVAANICKHESEYVYSSYRDYINHKVSEKVIVLVFHSDTNYMGKVICAEESENDDEIFFLDDDEEMAMSKRRKMEKENYCKEKVKQLYKRFEEAPVLDSSKLSNSAKQVFVVRELIKDENLNQVTIQKVLNITRGRFYSIIKKIEREKRKGYKKA